MEEGLPNIEAPPDGKYLGQWAHWTAWQVGRWITAVAGRSTPRGQRSVVQSFIRGLEDKNDPLPGDRPMVERSVERVRTRGGAGEARGWRRGE